MASTKPATRKRTARKPAQRTQVTRRPQRGRDPLTRLATWCARLIARHAASHRTAVRSRKDAAILRATHAGCETCHGTGTIFTKDKKTGSFSGSKPCPVKPTTAKVSRLKIHAAARVGVDKHSGLIGWTCPCGSREKPRHRDAKTATAALRTHERQKHGGVSVGGAWYAQLPEGAAPAKPAVERPTVSKVAPSSGMTDAEWEKQNSPISPAAAGRRGVCWCCGGKGALYSAFGGEHITTVCGICHGNGKPATAGASKGSA